MKECFSKDTKRTTMSKETTCPGKKKRGSKETCRIYWIHFEVIHHCWCSRSLQVVKPCGMQCDFFPKMVQCNVGPESSHQWLFSSNLPHLSPLFPAKPSTSRLLGKQPKEPIPLDSIGLICSLMVLFGNSEVNLRWQRNPPFRTSSNSCQS